MARIEHEIDTRFKSEQQRFVANLMFTSSWIRGLMTDLLRPFGISSQQYNILRILRGHGDWLTMNEVKRKMVEKAPNATRLADKLIDKKFIERQRSEEDRRVVYVKITSKGMELLKEIDKVEERENAAAFMENIPEEEARRFNDLLDSMRS